MKSKIIDYIKSKYTPLSIVIYGSYADGSNNENSDFDAMVISESCDVCHDTSFVDGVQLDVFVYPEAYFKKEYDCDEFIQIFDGNIVMDTNDIGNNLQTRVRAYIDGLPHKTDAEIRSLVDWCEKMRLRAKRYDAEGMFRWHWLLTDSLEIFCNIVRRPYFGPKKTLMWMEKQYPDAYACYKKALFKFDMEALDGWIAYIERCTPFYERKL